jgi:hypothetical protein
VAEWCRECQRCQQAKVTKQPAAAVQRITMETTRFTHVHVDLVGPMPALAEGYSYIFTIINCSTHWAEVFPVKSIATTDCAEA